MNSHVTYEIAPSVSRSLTIDCGCYPLELDTLYGGDNYQIPIGEVCSKCSRQFFWGIQNDNL